MSNPNRRDLLATLPLGAAVLSAPAFAVDHGHPIRARIAALRQRWKGDEARLQAHLSGHIGGENPHAARLAVVRRGFVAVGIFKELDHLTVEDQVHPAAQRLLRDITGALGAAVVAAGEAVGAWAEGDGVALDPEGVHLREAIAQMRADLSTAGLPPREGRMVDGVLSDLLEEPEPGWLRRRARVGARQARKVGRLAAEVAAAQDQTGLLDTDDEGLKARVAAAKLARSSDDWEEDDDAGVDEEGNAEGGASLSGDQVLGMFVLGVVWVGGLLISTIGTCAVLCGGPQVGLPVLILGIGIMVLSARGIRSIREEGEPSSSPSADPVEALSHDPQRPLVARCTVEGTGRWVSTGLLLNPDDSYIIHAWGLLVGGPGLGAADPDGDGAAASPEAPLPGAPRMGLLARIFDEVLFIGSFATLPGGKRGLLSFAVNAEPGLPGLGGAFQVAVQRGRRVEP